MTVRPRALLCRLAGFPLHPFIKASKATGNTEIKQHHNLTSHCLSLPENSSKNHLTSSSSSLPFIFYLTAALLKHLVAAALRGMLQSLFDSGNECLICAQIQIRLKLLSSDSDNMMANQGMWFLEMWFVCSSLFLVVHTI